jgi:prophage regulatory protein
MNPNIQLIRRVEVLAITKRSKSSLQQDEKNGVICPPISIGERAVAYIRSEVEAVIQARVKGHSQDQLRSLVKLLLSQRKEVGHV